MLSQEKIKAYVLSNAARYEGKASTQSVMGQILQDKPELKSDIKKLIKEIQTVINKVNSVSIVFIIQA